jgi:hypothetical protein
MRRRFNDQNCSVAQSLEVLGDWWTLLVVREAFLGVRRFADFEANLDISKNILTARLEHLVAHGVLDRWIYGKGREPVLALDRRSGRRIPRLRILDNEGRPLAGHDIALAPGPGATKRTRARLGARCILSADGSSGKANAPQQILESRVGT